MPILIDENKIFGRESSIRNLLLPLSKNNKDVSARIANSDRGTIVFAAHSGTKPIASNYREWIIRTHNEQFKSSYFEVWNQKNNQYSLKLAYFRLMLSLSSDYNEVLSLHIDPLEIDCKYKSGPHVHIMSSSTIISKAHISLNLSNLKEVINTYEIFNKAYENALKMINDEILLKAK